MHNPGILNNILTEAEELRSRGKSLLVVFDLDSTLFDLEPRILKILQEFGSQNEIQSNFPKAATTLTTLKSVPKKYHVTQFMEALGLSSESHDFYAAMDAWWLKRFYDDAAVIEDAPYPGAVEYVQRLHQAGASIIYLTGRDEPRMGEGTRQSLKHWSFPYEVDRVSLVLKPTPHLEDAQFKRDFFLSLEKGSATFSHDRPWLFENEPVNINLILKYCPHVRVVFLDSAHLGLAEAPGTDTPRIKDFVY